MPTPSFSEIIAQDYEESPAKKTPPKKVEGLRDDLDDIDENDVGKSCKALCFFMEWAYINSLYS